MTSRGMGTLSAVAAVLTPLTLIVVDELVVRASALHPVVLFPWWHGFLQGFEIASGMSVHKLLGPLVLALAALVCALRAPWRKYARPLIFVAACWGVTRLGANLLKVPFGRLRPRELLGAPHVDAVSVFFQGGGSFPSGHAAHAFGLALPLAILFPRWRVPIVAAAALVALARVAVNDHYLADVLASLAWAALVTWILARVLLPQPQPVASRRATRTRSIAA